MGVVLVLSVEIYRLPDWQRSVVHNVGVQRVNVKRSPVALQPVLVFLVSLKPRVRVCVAAAIRLAYHRVHFQMNLREPVIPLRAYYVLVPVERVASDGEPVKPLAELLMQRPSDDLNVVPDVVSFLQCQLVTYGAVLRIVNLQLGYGEVESLCNLRYLHGEFLQAVFECAG